ncbi:MAG: hypothetical protein PHF37_01740 [Phycisphaerae bacterium]|nr:hypothetical protein [Phycisphaerae bacterium]
MERRSEKRLRYNWPVWFAEDFNGMLSQGQMVDVCSGGASFNCYDNHSVQDGKKVTARFSIPHYGTDDSFELEDCICEGHICRVDDINNFVKRVAVQFASPLPFRPGEQSQRSDLPRMAAATAI